jgi:hypothetical protein
MMIKGTEVGYTRDQAEGAIPNGTRVRKINVEPRDAHPEGAEAVVVGSIGPAPWKGKMTYGYFVEWDDTPGIPVFITGTRIEVKE